MVTSPTRRFLQERDKLSQARTLAMHDDFAKVNEKWGLYRGTSITESWSQTPLNGRVPPFAR
jgi:hypothetical protein